MPRIVRSPARTVQQVNVELAALLDAPKPSAMGMRGVLLRDSSGLFTAGLRATRRVSDAEYEDLVEGGHVLPVEGDLPEPLLGADLTRAGALWVGEEFTGLASELTIGPPAEPRQGTMKAPGGRFWFDLPASLFATTQYWLKNALRLTVIDDDPRLTNLMLRVDSTSDFTRAALAYRSNDLARDIAWFVRLDTDSGLDTDATVVKARMDELIDGAQRPDGFVIALVAHAKHGSYDLGQKLAHDTGVKFEAFRDYFKTEAKRLFDGDNRTAMVDAGAIVTTFRSPDAIVESAVLRSLRPASTGVPASVIDGLRHSHILDALRRVPSIEVEVAEVTLPVQTLPSHIEESMTSADLAGNVTEREVDILVKSARYRLPQDEAEVVRQLVAV